MLEKVNAHFSSTFRNYLEEEQFSLPSDQDRVRLLKSIIKKNNEMISLLDDFPQATQSSKYMNKQEQ